MGYLSASQRSKVRRLSAPKEVSPDEEGGELNIVPFLDIIVNILIFVLATVSVTFIATIETAPSMSGQGGGVRKQDNKATLGLTVLISNSGFGVKTTGKNIGPGCDNTNPGLAVPKRGEQYDFEGLKACVTRLKHESEDFALETLGFVQPETNIPFSVLIKTMDALRCEGNEPCQFKPGKDGNKCVNSAGKEQKCLLPDIQFRVAL